MQPIVSTPHLAMKFPSVVGDIVMVHVDQKMTCECYVTKLKVESISRLYKSSPHGRSMVRRGCCPKCRETTGNDPEIVGQKRIWSPSSILTLNSMKLVLSLTRTFALYPSVMMSIRHMKTFLKPDDSKLVSQSLIDNVDFFSWTIVDMPRVSSDVLTHCLSIYKEAKPVAQKKNGRRKMCSCMTRGWEVGESRLHQKSTLHYMVGQCDHGQKIEWQEEDVH